MNSVCQKPGMLICKATKQLSVNCIEVEFDVRVHSNNLTQRSGVHKENSRGRWTEPCGTPNSSSQNSERVNTTLIVWTQWLRQGKTKPRQLRRIVWSIVPNEVDRSNKTSAVRLPHER